MGIVKTSTLASPIFVIPIYPFYGLALLEVRAGRGSGPSRRNHGIVEAWSIDLGIDAAI